jgi:hypothetical protein
VGQPQPREWLAALLWGGRGDRQARESLRQAVATLRRGLPATRPAWLVAGSGTLTVDPAALDTDVREFERLAKAGSLVGLERAAALYHGHLLADLDLDEPRDRPVDRRARLTTRRGPLPTRCRRSTTNPIGARLRTRGGRSSPPGDVPAPTTPRPR